MATLRDYFVNESNDYFERLAEAVRRMDARESDPAQLLKLARGLRGSAQLARETRVQQVAHGLELALRAIISGAIEWSTEISERTLRTLDDLRSLAAGTESDADAEARTRSALDRWRETGVPLADAPDSAAHSADDGAASRQFREFALHEISGIISELDTCLEQLNADPRNREGLKVVLRRQRALLGSARLDEVGVVAETLRAIEDLARIIAKLNLAVKDEWAAALRAARDVLRTAVGALESGNDPAPSPTLSKLRTLRNELMERYGDVEAVPAAPAAPAGASGFAAAQYAPVAAQPIAAAPAQPEVAQTASPDAVVPIEQLCYSGERALRRALELRARVEQLAGDDPDAREAVDEVFDLIRLGIG